MTNTTEETTSRRFECINCEEEFPAGEGELACPRCGTCYEGVRDGDTFEVWDGERVLDSWTLDIQYECQFCGEVHPGRKEHEEHVERMHYEELVD